MEGPGAVHISWVRECVIGKDITFEDFRRGNGINFHGFAMRYGLDFHDLNTKSE